MTSRQVDADARWDTYVASQLAGSLYHTTAWRDVVEDAFGKSAYFLRAENSSRHIVGVLPLIRIKSLLQGDRLVSMPYANYGGVLADSLDVANQLREAARLRAQALGVDHVELRETNLSPDVVRWGTRSNKVIMRLMLPKSIEDIDRVIGAKRRSQARRPLKEGAETEVGSTELITPFYDLFSRNMRDLGTPVYPRSFFDAIAARCPDRIRIVLVRVRGRPAAAGFLLRWRETMEIPWAASNREFNAIGINMLLYREAIRTAIEQGSAIFDFGRSTHNSGTFRFKRQWGAESLECRWRYWPSDGAAAGSERARKLAARVWQKLPLAVANRIGPWVSPGLPW